MGSAILIFHVESVSSNEKSSVLNLMNQKCFYHKADNFQLMMSLHNSNEIFNLRMVGFSADNIYSIAIYNSPWSISSCLKVSDLCPIVWSVLKDARRLRITRSITITSKYNNGGLSAHNAISVNTEGFISLTGLNPCF